MTGSRPNEWPDWERVLAAAAHLQRIFPDAVLVGGTAAALHARHRFSRDADHVLEDLKRRFDSALKDLEAVSGWKTARVQRPVQILGSLDGIETGVRQLIREAPLETERIDTPYGPIRVPTLPEMLRIKAILILRRNATRDYIDFAALYRRMRKEDLGAAMRPFDALYPQPSGESALQQLQAQLANPLPYDLDEIDLSEYKHLAPEWQDWRRVRQACMEAAKDIFDLVPAEPGVDGQGQEPA